MHEAFRISLGSLVGERPVSQDQKKLVGIQHAVQQLLKPLGLANRLHFFRDPDRAEGNEWLVVKIETSGQLPLLEQLENDWSDDPELGRECASALGLARDALSVLRKLAAAARMAPFQFHAILKNESAMTANSLRLMEFADAGLPAIVVRNPQGHDVSAQIPVVPRRETMPSFEEMTFLVKMVGRTSALVRRVKNGDVSQKPTCKEIKLHWGEGVHRPALAKQFFTAMEDREILTVWTRETVNAKGKVVRLEWGQNVQSNEGTLM